MSASWIALATLSGLIWLGFVLHTSGGEGLFFDKYSPSYAGLLVSLTLLWLLVLWWGWRRPKRLGRTLRLVGLNLLVAGLLLALVLSPAYIYLHHRSLAESLLGHVGPEAHAFYQIDMAPPVPNASGSDTVRVLAVGGSTTYGSRVEREQAYPAVLERLLNERFGETRFTVHNAGVPWHTSMHSLLRYVAAYAAWKPHVVIVMHAFNDIYQTSEGQLTSGHFRSDYGHFFGALANRMKPKDHFAERTARALTKNWLARIWYSDLFTREPEAARVWVDLRRALPSFRRNLFELVRRAGDDGAMVVVLTQPHLYRNGMPEEERRRLFYDYYYRDYATVPTIEEQTAAMDAFNRSAREVAAAADVLIVDLEDAIPKETALMYDDVHYTVQGAALVASVVAEQVPWIRLLVEERDR